MRLYLPATLPLWRLQSSERCLGEAGEDLKWGELDATAPLVSETTRRLAICNMDWDRVKSVDLLVLCHSFKPAAGSVESVVVSWRMVVAQLLWSFAW